MYAYSMLLPEMVLVDSVAFETDPVLIAWIAFLKVSNLGLSSYTAEKFH